MSEDKGRAGEQRREEVWEIDERGIAWPPPREIDWEPAEPWARLADRDDE